MDNRRRDASGRHSNQSEIGRGVVSTDPVAKVLTQYRRRNAMRLANRVLFCALAIFVLSVVGMGQAPRDERDPRNPSPSVGTGGPEGGPTGLFTIYDGQVLRKGEFSFSVAFSNYDRDPGNVDITDWPASFNVGLTDHIELFFKTNAYRGIKVNNPQNLSSFYLPNVQGFFSGTLLGSGPAVILSPQGPNVGTLAGTAVFRPPFCPACAPAGIFNVYYNAGQPLVAYPYTGGAGPNFGLGPGFIGSLFGFPGFSATLGPPSGGTSNFGAAGRFPGVGSPVGSILPGVVLATQILPCTALTGNCQPPALPGTQNPIIVPITYTVSPSYLPDAPFVSRLYGESSLTNFVGGAKIRLTDPRSAFGFGFIPFYRWYPDTGGSPSDFNQLQRGASPGGDIGDFGLVMFVDGRLSRSVNLSANLGYILNSNPKDPSGVAMLDRPDEIIAGVGVDFPINKYVQPMAELRSTQYVGGRTPNAFPNNPVEFTAGIKIYPARWWGFGAWFRRALNDQRAKNLNPVDATVPVNNITNVNVPGRGLVVVPGTSFVATSAGVPLGFQPSSDPYGFGAQLWFGHRHKREPAILPNQPPTAALAASTTSITLPCPPGQHSSSGGCPAGVSTTVSLTTTASDPDGDTLLYSYTVTGGRITGEGANVSWDLSGVGPGTYTASVDVDDGCGCITSATTTVTIANCPDCVPDIVCPAPTASCPDAVEQGQSITFTVGGNLNATPAISGYNWTVSAGTITSGQGTPSITVSTDNLGGQSVTATVELAGVDPSCPRTASCTTSIKAPPAKPRLFDEYGNIRFNDEKARLDNYAIQLQNEPTAQGYIIAYGSCDAEGQTRGNRAKDYLVNTRGIDAGRLVVVDGGCMPELKVQLWIVPQGATPPTPDTTGAVSPCPDCKKKPVRRRGTRRR
jgi:PKD-like domain